MRLYSRRAIRAKALGRVWIGLGKGLGFGSLLVVVSAALLLERLVALEDKTRQDERGLK